MQPPVTLDSPSTVNAPADLDPEIANEIESRQSIEAFHSTIFESFGLSGEFVYNRFVQDETTVASPTTGSVDEIPRYNYISWKTVPELRRETEIPVKGNRTPTKPSAHVFDRSGFTFTPTAANDLLGARVSLANGFVSPGTIRARVSAPSKTTNRTRFDEELHLLNGSPGSAAEARANLESALEVVPESSVRSTPAFSSTTRVTFVDPGIAGAFSDDRVAATVEPEHAASIVSLSQIAASIETISEFNQIDGKVANPPEFPAPSELLGVSYMGYVIEKYVVGDDSSIDLVETIVVDDISARDFYDRAVVYGMSYAYRIRAIVRWVRRKGTSFNGTSSSSSLDCVCSFYAGDWSEWVHIDAVDSTVPSPPDEFTVRPVSSKKQIHVSWKVPDNRRRDLTGFRLYRKLVIAGEDASEWTVVADVSVSNGLYIDDDVMQTNENIDTMLAYAMTSATVHGNVSPLSTQLAAAISPLYEQLGEEPVKQLSQQGVPLSAVGTFSRLPPPSEPPPLRASRELVLSLRSGQSSFPVFITDYIVRMTSELTGETVDVPLRLSTTDGPGTSVAPLRSIIRAGAHK